MQNDDKHWLAGLLEGEGCFGMYGRRVRGKVYRQPSITLKMVDSDVVLRAATILNHGRLGTVNLPSGKTAYILHVQGQKSIDIMRELLCLMGNRRSQKIWDIIQEWNEMQEAKIIK